MQNNSKVKSYLRDGKIVVPKNFFKGLEDGAHIVQIHDVEIVEFKEGLVGMKLTCKNSKLDVGIYNIYMDDNPCNIFAQLIKACYEEMVDEIDHLDLVGYVVEIKVRTRGNYQNLAGIAGVGEEELEIFTEERKKVHTKSAKRKKDKDKKVDEENEEEDIDKSRQRSRSERLNARREALKNKERIRRKEPDMDEEEYIQELSYPEEY